MKKRTDFIDDEEWNEYLENYDACQIDNKTSIYEPAYVHEPEDV